ncbi:type II toxin-antitoxin system HicA family toxin [Candidatus Uhrbacteria bacterium]|nr:type II toxin-antitoxin system HicA family toxin [Candidatus Uhrbacteria bacterium]
MSPKIPVLTSRVVIQALERAGFVIHRQSGSHVILKRESDKRRVTVPFHNRDLRKGTLRSILREASLSIEQLVELL